jgi:DNA polymerase-1
VLGPGEVRGYLDGLPAGVRVGVHVRGTWGAGRATRTRSASRRSRRRRATPGPTTPPSSTCCSSTRTTTRRCAAWLADPSVEKAMHDAKGPLLALRARGWTVAGLTSDTALAAYLALPGQGVFDLADLALRFLRRELRAEVADDGQLSFDAPWEEGLPDAGAADAAVRARAVADLAVALDQDLERRGGTGAAARPRAAAGRGAGRLRAHRHRRRRRAPRALESRLREQVKAGRRGGVRHVGHEFHLGSPKQLQALLFDELGCRRPRRSRPATRPTPTRCRTSSAPTRSSRRCCCTAR